MDFDALSIQTGPLAALWANFSQTIFQLFHFHTGRPILITPEGQYWEKGNFSTPKLDETEGFQCLGHSNWTICSPLSHFCFQIFPTFTLSYWETNSYYPRMPRLGKGQFLNSKTGWDRGFPVPRAFKLDHLQPIEPLLFPYFSNFYTFILGGQFLLPQMNQ